MRGDSGALISIQNNEAVPMRFEDIKDPATGKTRVRKVNIKSVQYRIARGSMMRMEKEDLDDPGLANAYRLPPKEFKALCLSFETGESSQLQRRRTQARRKA